MQDSCKASIWWHRKVWNWEHAVSYTMNYFLRYYENCVFLLSFCKSIFLTFTLMAIQMYSVYTLTLLSIVFFSIFFLYLQETQYNNT